MKYFCFRFDVDTHKCLKEGVPNLLKLGKKLHIKFTFFINFGQALDHREFIKERILNLKQSSPANSLSAFAKLGLWDSLVLTLFNPYIGKNNLSIIQNILKSNHEIGLHGGKNHETWLRNAKKWPKKTIKKEIVWGHNILKSIFSGKSVCGFASPGFNGSSKINKILHELGFSYVADIHSGKPVERISIVNKLKQIPTNITGEPGGVGYIEYCRALGMTDLEILEDFEKKLQKRKRLAVVYDHPYYAGTKELNLVEQMIKLVKKLGYKIVTMEEISKNL